MTRLTVQILVDCYTIGWQLTAAPLILKIPIGTANTPACISILQTIVDFEYTLPIDIIA